MEYANRLKEYAPAPDKDALAQKVAEIKQAALRNMNSEVYKFYFRHRSWRVMIIGGAICTQLLQQVVNSTK